MTTDFPKQPKSLRLKTLWRTCMFTSIFLIFGLCSFASLGFAVVVNRVVAL
ncbi:MAG: hypothetical protein SFZ02_12505 [bacterium]|nr:hypothetical protein [bacterium]